VREPTEGLDPGERLRAYAAMSFRGAASVSASATMTMRGARARMQAYYDWEDAAIAADFPPGGPDCVLGVTDTRLLVWRTSFGLNRPTGGAGCVPIERIAQVNTPLRGLVTGLALALTNGAIIQFEAMRGRRVRALGHEIKAAMSGQDSAN
jgi:hypothetical protein